MSAPYVYTPLPFEPTRYLGYGTYNQRSPFIPPATLYPSSPYPPSSPYLRPNTPQGVHFNDAYWGDPPARRRRPSWHGGGMPPSPFLSAGFPSTGHRRRSFGGAFRPWDPASSSSSSSPWVAGGSPFSSSHFQVHPLLNGEAPRRDLYFDLAAPSFAPLRFINGRGGQQSVMISADELHEPATYPPITRMRISHDAIPQWPIDLEYQYDDGYAVGGGASSCLETPPITLGDVLYIIHHTLHRQITHQDWARLSVSEETAIARAYTRRCRSVPSSAEVEASQGVKRIDYLRERHVFRGLIRSHDEDGFYHWRLLTN